MKLDQAEAGGAPLMPGQMQLTGVDPQEVLVEAEALVMRVLLMLVSQVIPQTKLPIKDLVAEADNTQAVLSFMRVAEVVLVVLVEMGQMVLVEMLVLV